MNWRVWVVLAATGIIAVWIIGCGGSGSQQEAPRGEQVQARSITSTEGFTFLPPIGSDAMLGSFDAEAEPTVRAVKDGATIVEFPPDDGTGQSDTVRLNEEEQYFIVNWHTGKHPGGLQPGDECVIEVLVAGAVRGSADVLVIGRGKPPKVEDVFILRLGRTVPIKFRLARPRSMLVFNGYGSPGNLDVFTINPDGSGLQRITDDPATDTAPAWSPDGRQITFTSNRDGNAEVYVMNADGSDQVNLTNSPDSEGESTWSGDGSMIAFGWHRPGEQSDIHVINVDGTGRRALTNTPEPEGYPAFSPDGQKVAFSRLVGPYNWEIFVSNVDGTGENRLTYADWSDNRPAWSRDGGKIIFGSERGGNAWRSQIFTMDPDGSSQVNITHNSYRHQFPTFSPDQTQIACARGPYNTSTGWEIHVMNADGTGVVQLTPTDGVPDMMPDWSPWLW